jgi:hypothetical protein
MLLRHLYDLHDWVDQSKLQKFLNKRSIKPLNGGFYIHFNELKIKFMNLMVIINIV